MRILLVGGGTGGHFYPLIAVAEALNEAENKPELYYMGPDKFDQEALEKERIKFVHCPAGKMRRYFSIRNFTDVFKNIFGFFAAIFKLFTIYPDVIFSKGSYTSVPVLLAAKVLLIPIIIHESDSVPGRANKLGARLARYIAISYDEAAKFFPKKKTALIGIPIRKVVRQTYDKTEARNFLEIPTDKPLIYVTGGSQGAERLNTQIVKVLPQLLPVVSIFHQVGDIQVEPIKEVIKTKVPDKGILKNYYLQGYLDEKTVALVLSAADLVISRAGSTTLFETALHDLPSLLVPIPESISHDQRTNAYAYARDGAAVVLEEENLTDGLLVQEVMSALQGEQREKMVAAARSMKYPEAANKIADILIGIGKEHGS